MKRMWLMALLGLILVVTSGCYRNTVDDPNVMPDNRVMQERRVFLFNGLMNRNRGPVVAHRLCNGPVKSVETVHTAGNQVVMAITFLIYTPNTVRVTCASGQAHDFYLDDEELLVGSEGAQESGDLI